MAAMRKDQRHSDDDVYRVLAERSISVPDGCRLWVGGSLTPKGYGMIRHRQVWCQVHRAMYELTFGDLPRGVHVLHTCDVRNCVQPYHLYLGDNTKNIEDKCQRDRSGKKLTISLVRSIRDRIKKGETCVAVADELGVHPTTISRDASGVRWAHVRQGGV